MQENHMEEAVKKHGDKLLRTALAILFDKTEAEDVVQDVFVKLVEKQPRFTSVEHETAWLIRVTVNLCKDRLRSQRRQKTVQLLESYPAQNDDEKNIIETIASLPAKYRTVIHLAHFEGYSLKEIAVITNQREAAVRKQHSRARNMLRDMLKEEAPV